MAKVESDQARKAALYHQIGDLNFKIEHEALVYCYNAEHYYKLALETQSLTEASKAQIHTKLGKIYSHPDSLNDPIEEYTSALAIGAFTGPDRAMCHVDLANIYSKQKRYYEALYSYNQALDTQKLSKEFKATILSKIAHISIKPTALTGANRAKTFLNLGNAYAQIKNLPNAFKFYTLALREPEITKPDEAICLDAFQVTQARLNYSTCLDELSGTWGTKYGRTTIQKIMNLPMNSKNK